MGNDFWMGVCIGMLLGFLTSGLTEFWRADE